MERIRIFLLGNTSHPEHLAAMASEREVLTEAYGDEFWIVDPGEFAAHQLRKEITVSSAREFRERIQNDKSREFAEDSHAMLTCDGVLVMADISGLDRLGTFLYTIALRAGMRMSNNIADLMHELRRANAAGHLDWRPKHVDELAAQDR